jgi:hypothetical protein
VYAEPGLYSTHYLLHIHIAPPKRCLTNTSMDVMTQQLITENTLVSVVGFGDHVGVGKLAWTCGSLCFCSAPNYLLHRASQNVPDV